MTAHSKIGASSYERWRSCPGSVRLSEGITSPTSRYAEEGTKAHEVGAFFLTHERFPPKDSTLVTEEMLDAVEVYINAIAADRKQIPEHPNNLFLVEHGFNLSSVHPGLFGTADCVLYDATTLTLRVYDYKHGAGIPVDVKDKETGQPNVQLAYYGLGALTTLNLPVDKVVLTIVQPRAPHSDGPVRSVELDAFEMLDFASQLKKDAKATEDPKAPLHTGPHCRFCPASPTCPKLRREGMALVQEVVSFDLNKLSQLLHWLPTLEGWAENVRKFAYAEAERGVKIPGFKLVPKQARRKWREGVTVETIADHFKLDESYFTEAPSLLSPAQAEKKLHPKARPELEQFIEKVSSGQTLVPDSDNREEVKTGPQAYFEPIPNNVLH